MALLARVFYICTSYASLFISFEMYVDEFLSLCVSPLYERRDRETVYEWNILSFERLVLTFARVSHRESEKLKIIVYLWETSFSQNPQ